MAYSQLADWIKVVGTVTGTGAVGLSLGGVTGFRAFSAGLASGDTVYYSIYTVDAAGNPNDQSETGIGTFTIGGGGTTHTLSRDVVLESTNGGVNLVNFVAGVTKHVVMSAPSKMLLPAPLFQGRLTLDANTADPTTAGNISGINAQTLQYVPYTGDQVCLFNGYGLRRYRLANGGTGLSLSGLTAGKNYDVFLYGTTTTNPTLELGPAWTNDTTRATTIVKTGHGLWTKNGDPTRNYVGTIRMAATGQSEDSDTKRYVWNAYNQVKRRLWYQTGSDAVAYATNAWANYANDANCLVQAVVGLSGLSLIHI